MGVISLGIEGIQICYKTFKRYEDYKHSLQSIPDTLEACQARLMTLQGILKQIAEEDGNERGVCDDHLRLTYDILGKHVNKLNIIINGLQKKPEDTRRQLLHKATKSLRKEDEIAHISKVLGDAVQDLTLGRLQSLKALVVGHECLDKSHEPSARQNLAPSYGLPPKQLSRLIGREEILSELKADILQTASQTCPLMLWSLSGMGKTQTVLELINDPDIKKTYETVIWINASSITAIVKQYEKIAVEMSLPGGTFSDAQSKITFVLSALEKRQKPPLLVFDNFDASIEPSELMPFLPKHRPYTIIYIKQHSDPGFQGKSHMVPALSVDKAVELLLERSAHQGHMRDFIHAQSIVRRLGCLPLAIVQAGSWLRSSKLPLNQFFSQFNLYFPFVFQNLGSQDVFARNVSTTWALAMEAFSSDKSVRDDMTQMLLFCSILHNDVINGRFAPYLWRDMEDAPAWTKAFLSDGEWSDSKFAAVIQKLGEFSLVNILDWREGHCHFSIHPMIRQWIRTRVKTSILVEITLYSMRLIAAEIDRAEGHPMDLKKATHFRLYIISSLQSLSELRGLEGTSEHLRQHSKDIVDLKYNYALFISTLADFAETSNDRQIGADIDDVALLEECYEGYSRMLGMADPLVAKIGDQLGNAYINRADFENAERVLREILVVEKRPMSSSLAKCYRKQGRTEEATEAYEVMLSEEIAGSLSEFELLRSMMGCALNDNNKGEYTRAEKWFKEIVKVAKTDPEQARIKGEAYDNLSDIYWRWGRQMEGAEMQLEAFRMYEIAYGAEDPRTIMMGHILAKEYFSISEWFKCEQLYCKIIAGYEAAYGSDSLHTNQARHCHSHTLCSLGRQEEGEAAHTATFYDLLAKPGVEDEFVRSLFGCVLGVYDHMGLETKRLELYERTLDRAREVFVETDAFRMRLTRGLARIYAQNDRWADAEAPLREAIAAHEAFVASRQPTTIASRDKAELEVETGGEENNKQQTDMQDGSAQDDEAPAQNGFNSEGADRIDTDERPLDDSDPLDKYIDDLEALGEVLRSLDRFAEAEPVYRSVLDLRKRYYVEYDPPTMDAMLELAKVYEGQDKYDESDALMDEYEAAMQARMMAQVRKAREETRLKRKAAEAPVKQMGELAISS